MTARSPRIASRICSTETSGRGSAFGWPLGGNKEEGSITTLDMVMLTDLDRSHLAVDVTDRVPGLAVRRTAQGRFLIGERLRCRRHGEDAPDVVDWTWQRGSLPR